MAEPPIRFLSSAMSKNTRLVLSPTSVRSWGVHVLLTSSTGEKAVTMRDKGALTSRSSPLSLHFIDIDIESLPTGIPTPNAGHKSIPIVLTASYNAAPSPGLDAAHIQLALSLMREISPTFAAIRFVNDSATAMRAEAAALSNATGVRSPMDMASPVLTSNPYDVLVTATSATGTCHGPTIWSLVTRPVMLRSPIVIRNDLDPTEGRRRTRSIAMVKRSVSVSVWGR